jgi:hypothetical protein
MDSYGFLWIPMDSYGFLWISMDSYGYGYGYGFLWIPMDSPVPQAVWQSCDCCNTARHIIEKVDGIPSQLAESSLWSSGNCLAEQLGVNPLKGQPFRTNEPALMPTKPWAARGANAAHLVGSGDVIEILRPVEGTTADGIVSFFHSMVGACCMLCCCALYARTN